jgi:hypothetical protein
MRILPLVQVDVRAEKFVVVVDDLKGAVAAAVTYLTALDEVLASERVKVVVEVVQAVVSENREGYLRAEETSS